MCIIISNGCYLWEARNRTCVLSVGHPPSDFACYGIIYRAPLQLRSLQILHMSALA